MKKVVIIPTYNEKENIEKIIRKVTSYDNDYHTLIVDDGSPDGTGQIVKSLQKSLEGKVHLIERSGKLGLGTAYIAGFKWAIENKYDYIFEMDADFSHNPDMLDALYDACHNGGADVSIGSRYVRGGKIENWPLLRKLISYGGSIYSRIILMFPVKDTTAGFICYKRKVLESIDLDDINFIGYAFQIAMKYRSHKRGFKVVEVPIVFVDRKEGTSKMSKGIVKEAMYGVWQMRKFK